MSASNASSSCFSLTFVDDAFSGPAVDASGRTIYLLATDKSALVGLKESSVDRVRPDGTTQRVADIQWRKGTNVHIRGKDCGKFLRLGKKGPGLLSQSEYWFNVEDGRQFYWKNIQCFTASGEHVATYRPPWKQLFKSYIPACLAVDKTHADLTVLEYILVSAMLGERDRRRISGAATTAACAGLKAIPPEQL